MLLIRLGGCESRHSIRPPMQRRRRQEAAQLSEAVIDRSTRSFATASPHLAAAPSVYGSGLRRSWLIVARRSCFDVEYQQQAVLYSNSEFGRRPTSGPSGTSSAQAGKLRRNTCFPTAQLRDSSKLILASGPNFTKGKDHVTRSVRIHPRGMHVLTPWQMGGRRLVLERGSPWR